MHAAVGRVAQTGKLAEEVPPRPVAAALGAAVPQISWFYGIAIYMQFTDHDPPHLHAYYAEHEAKVALSDGEVVAGYLPARAARLVAQWVHLHCTELEEAWLRAMRHEPPGTIEPLQ